MHLFLAPPGADEPGPEIESLNNLLRGERAAVIAYRQVLAGLADHPAETEIRSILRDHESTVDVLCNLIRNQDCEPDEGAGPVSFAQVDPMRMAATFTALYAGEQQGLENCEAFLQVEHLPEDARFAVQARILPRCHQHIDTLAELTNRPPPKG
jgi:hypothetical protein